MQTSSAPNKWLDILFLCSDLMSSARETASKSQKGNKSLPSGHYKPLQLLLPTSLENKYFTEACTQTVLLLIRYLQQKKTNKHGMG